MSLELIKTERASDQVLRALRNSILDLTFMPGERLNPHDLAARLGVSLTPVKDAITRLTAEGLVEIKPRSGTFVADLSADDVAETFEIRRALECLAAESAVQNLTDHDIKRFRKLLVLMAHPLDTPHDREEHAQANSELHQRIVALSQNRKLEQLYAGLNAHIKIARVHHSRAGWAARMDQEQAEHREIVDALEARDSTRLISALRDHIGRAAASLVADLRERPSSSRQGAR
jgi:DNA-binding GntR family transcriptional regulator